MNPHFKFLFVIFSINLLCLHASGQRDTLPKFSVKRNNGAIYISWVNPFKNPIQINIQRSKDSLKNFITIHSVADPTVKSYQYQDKTAKIDSGYYRIFILFEGTNYQFTKSARPIASSGDDDIFSDSDNQLTNNIFTKKTETQSSHPTSKPAAKDILKDNNSKERSEESQKAISQNIPIKANQAVTDNTNSRNIDLIILKPVRHTKDNYYNILKQKLKRRPNLPSWGISKRWQASNYIFTGDDGNVIIKLPEAKQKNYSVTFLKEEGRPLFSIPKIESPIMMLDKVSFLKSGWYYFELREGNKVLERNKFLITRDY